MNFLEAITSGFNNYFNFKGRASRSAFWFFILFEIIYFFIAGLLLGFAGVTDEVFAIAVLVLVIPVLIPGISLTARRLHDFNQSGWMQCIFIPGFFIINTIGAGLNIYVQEAETFSMIDLIFTPEIYLPIMAFVILMILSLILKRKLFDEPNK